MENKHIFNDLKRELRNLSLDELKKKLKEKQEELFKGNSDLVSGSKRVMYNKENKFNIKKIKKTIKIIKTIINEKGD